MNKIKVVLIEDDEDWLKSLSTYINTTEDIIVIGTAKSRNDALDIAMKVETDIFLVDINLNENRYDGINLIREISNFSKAKIIMITSLREELVVEASFSAGAVHFVSKEYYEDIPNIIRSTHKTISPIEVLAKKYKKLKKEEQLSVLTSAERELYDLVEQGHTQSEIQNNLVITKNTLKFHVKNILNKLGAKSMKEVVKKVKHGSTFDIESKKQANINHLWK